LTLLSPLEFTQSVRLSLVYFILYDLDRQQIVDFRLKAWADNFVVLRTALYDENEGEKGEKENYPLSIEVGNPVPHRGRRGGKRSNSSTPTSSIFAHTLVIIPSAA
jgi:hypothetical protein